MVLLLPNSLVVLKIISWARQSFAQARTGFKMTAWTGHFACFKPEVDCIRTRGASSSCRVVHIRSHGQSVFIDSGTKILKVVRDGYIFVIFFIRAGLGDLVDSKSILEVFPAFIRKNTEIKIFLIFYLKSERFLPDNPIIPRIIGLSGKNLSDFR